MKGKRNLSLKLLAVMLCLLLLSSCGKNSAPGGNTGSFIPSAGNGSSTEAGTGSGIGAGTESGTGSGTGTGSGAGSGTSIGSENTGTGTVYSANYDSDDYYTNWENLNPNYINFEGSSITFKGSGAVVNGNKINITSGGVYVVSGKLDNGRIIVDVTNKATVRLVLNGTEIYCNDTSPIYVKNAGKTIITLQEGTQNYVTDGENYVFPDSNTDEPNAPIFSHDDLTINGNGTLIVKANYNNGIVSKNDLRITGGNIQIYSVDDGLIGRDMVAINGGNITIEAGGNGIKSTNDTEVSKGFIAIDGGIFSITAGADGIQAPTSVLINGGKFNITTGGGNANSSDKTDNINLWGRWGRSAIDFSSNTISSNANNTGSQSAKGIKSSSAITINGGTFLIDSSDDAIHSNNVITISGGDISISTGDDGIHADSSITISGGNINIEKSYEGIESAVITISNGNINIVSKDDGINIAGGNDGSAVNGRPGQNAFRSSGNNKLIINGGNITIDATGDGLDANGSIYMTGGTVLVHGPTSNGNGALDYDGVFEISGGYLIAAGSAGMAQAPSNQSIQYSIMMNYSRIQQAGTKISLKDSQGNTVAEFTPAKVYQSVVISSPELESGKTYTLYSGNEKVTEFTISAAVTWLSESGVIKGGGFNPGQPGNVPGRRR